MESSEEMVTPRAAASEADEEERKAGAAEVPVERAVEAREEVIVDALPPETAGQEREGKVDAAVQESVVQQPEAHEVEVPEVKREVAMVHPVQEPEPKVDEVVVLEETSLAPEVQEPEVKSDGANVVVQEPETKGGNVVAKDSTEVSRPREAVDVHTTEVNDLCGFSSVTPLSFLKL